MLDMSFIGTRNVQSDCVYLLVYKVVHEALRPPAINPRVIASEITQVNRPTIFTVQHSVE